MKNKKNIYWITESAVMIALAIVLELVSKMIIPELPFGGQITIVAMLPIVVVGWKYGLGKGAVTGLVYALVEMAMGAGTISAAALPSSEDYLGSVGKVALMICLDYILAYTSIGLAAMYKGKIQKATVSLPLGAFTALLLRYVCHIISGFVLYGAWAEWFFTQEGFYSWGQTIVEKFSGNSLAFIYSCIYNGIYMIPEIILTTIAAVVISRIPQIIKTKQN